MNSILHKWVTLVLLNSAFLTTFAQPVAGNGNNEVNKTYNGPDKNLAITTIDEKYIKWNAERIVKRFIDLLNFISTSQGLEVTEVENIIHQSYAHPESKLFYDSTSIVEDDLHVNEKDKRSREKVIFRYLKDFDLLYKKSAEGTVSFSNVKTSNIKSKDYLYIKVFFNCQFNNKSRVSDQAYQSEKRVAELKVEKLNNTWKTWITNIYFRDSLDITEASKNDIIVKDLPVVNTMITLGNETPVKPIQSENVGNDKLRDSPEELYAYYMKEALFAESLKNFDDALKNYQLAVQNKPAEKARLGKKIGEIKTRLDNIKTFEEKYQAGLYKDAITDYDNAIRKDPSNLDYYFGRAKCYIKTTDYNLAVKDCDKVIKIDPSYIQAYKMKGAIYEIQELYPDAITNYEISADIEKNNITLYHKIASLYVSLGNITAAIATFDKAISANDKIAFPYHLRGELLYKLNRIPEAEASFDTAITLDATKAVSYFYRGLCRYDLKNIDQALADFTKAKELNLENRYIQRIPQISADINKAINH